MKSLKFEKFLTLRNSFRISKQAQAGQMIVYLLAIVIFGMILVFGYKAVVNIRQKTDTVDYLAFQKSLEADINSIAFDYDSVKKADYSVRGYTEVCFADLKHSHTSPPDTSNIVLNSIESKIKKNVFLVGNKIDSFYIAKLNLTGSLEPLYKNPLCVDIENGKLKIKLTGQGDSTLVEKQP